MVLSTLTPNSDPIPPRGFFSLRSLCVHLARLFFFFIPNLLQVFNPCNWDLRVGI